MKYILLIIFLIGMVSCKDAKKSELVPIDNTSEKEVVKSEQAHPGKKSWKRSVIYATIRRFHKPI